MAAPSGFGWMFSHTSTGSSQVKTFTQKKNNNNNKNISKLPLLILYSGPIYPFRKSHFLCGVLFSYQPIKKLNQSILPISSPGSFWLLVSGMVAR